MDISERSHDHVSLESPEASTSPARENMHSSPPSNPTSDLIGVSPGAYGWSSFLPEAEMPLHWGSNTENLNGMIGNEVDFNWSDIDSGINLNDCAVPRHLTWSFEPGNGLITEGFNHFNTTPYLETQSIDLTSRAITTPGNTDLVSNEFKLEPSEGSRLFNSLAVPSSQQWPRNIITATSLKASQQASYGISRPTVLPNPSSTTKGVDRSAVSSKKGKRVDSPADITDQSRKKPKQMAGTHEATTHRRLACPFFLQDREKHLDCLHFNLKRTKDVKQHIQRKHSSQNCQRGASMCDSQRPVTIGSLQADFRSQLRTCSEAISTTQSHKLSMRNSISQNEEEQWFRMWDILFPDTSATERPKTAYLESNVQEIITTVRRVWKNKGHAALSSALTSTEGTETTPESADMLSHVDRLLNHLSMVARHETSDSASDSNSSTENHSVVPAQHSNSPPPQHSQDGSTRYINGLLVRDSWTETDESNASAGSGSDSSSIGSLANMTSWLLETEEYTCPGYSELQLDGYEP